MLAGG